MRVVTGMVTPAYISAARQILGDQRVLVVDQMLVAAADSQQVSTARQPIIRTRRQSAEVAGAEKGGKAARHRGDHEDRPCLKGDIHHLAARGQGVRDRR